MGPVNLDTVTIHTIQIHTATLEETVSRFRELDSVPSSNQMTLEEKEAEDHFVNHHSRTTEGRYCVPLPFKSNVGELGGSYHIALRRLHQVERRLLNAPDRKVQYDNFMLEYLALGHMEEVPPQESGDLVIDGSVRSCYMPHHFVVKEDSSTTKLRVVFDGSCATTTGVPLNKCLSVGATIQQDVFLHLVKFRMNPIALKADINKMYRQFIVPKEDSNFQRILWRQHQDQQVKEFRLKTITYGTSSAPFCAVRALQQLAKDEQSTYPQASKVMLNDFYVDDLMSGGSTNSDVINLYHELSKLTGQGKLELRQWASNSKEVLEVIPIHLRASSSVCLSDHFTTKALGCKWEPEHDVIQYSTFDFTTASTLTNRIVLRDLSRLFDPLGLLAPFVVSIKIYFQKLWFQKIGWDEPLPADLQTQWINYCNQFVFLENLQIPRTVVQAQFDEIELHGFCDASEHAYAAVIFIRTFFQNRIQSRVLTAKTKVAPVKAQSLPRLELCGALLLAKLISLISPLLNFECPIYCWTDCEIVLKWISSPSRRWVTFVANRVSEIQQLLNTNSWRYIPGEINPADCASRGIPLEELTKHPLWWAGPSFLQESGIPCFQLPVDPLPKLQLQGERKIKALTVQIDSSIISRYSCYKKLRRIVAAMMKFILKVKKQSVPEQAQLLELAQQRLIYISQQEDFGLEADQLIRKGKLNPTSKLKSLHPFIDSNGLLRVGGRLSESSLPDTTKHQLIISGKSTLAKLIVTFFHFKHHHAGNRLLLSLLQREFWIIRGRERVKSVTSRCLRCRLLKKRTADQLMGTLPKSRVNPSPPFSHSGVDYAGPFKLQMIDGRGRKQFKAYFCVFICMATKAVHHEAVTDLSSEAFIATLNRFTSRRGVPAHIYSDCGSNFKGAQTELLEFVSSERFNHDVSRFLSDSGVTWHFNPPAAPHHGGLWESAVKSTKYHLQRIAGGSTMTLPEFQTILTQAEAAMNSRPLIALTNDPEEYTVLTPGHFLIGRPLLAVPQDDLQEIAANRLSRWQHQQQMFQMFWKAWSLEYLTTLQQRNKWTKENPNVTIGDLVAIKEDNQPPLRWKLARIISTYPGNDGFVRVVKVKSATGEYTRPITKIVPLLPVDQLTPQ